MVNTKPEFSHTGAFRFTACLAGSVDQLPVVGSYDRTCYQYSLSPYGHAPQTPCASWAESQ